MRHYDLQDIELGVAGERAFEFIADPRQLPLWTKAFARVADGRALLRTPQGEVEIDLDVEASAERGTIDWIMRFPDGNVARAYSRVVALGPSHSAYSFVLTRPPVPLEQLEGALEAQSAVLAEELCTLKRILEAGA